MSAKKEVIDRKLRTQSDLFLVGVWGGDGDGRIRSGPGLGLPPRGAPMNEASLGYETDNVVSMGKLLIPE